MAKICTVCGKKYVYAKGLCKSCYDRARKNGAVTSTYQQEKDREWIGRVVNGWKVVERLPNQRVIVECMDCHARKNVGTASVKRLSTKPCVCRIRHLRPTTETQTRVYKALLSNNGNISKTAVELGVSKQAVSSVLETIRKNNNV